MTGASRGIGLRIAQDLAAEGATVLAVSRSQGDVDKVADEIRVQGGSAEGIALDVRNPQHVKSVLSRVVEKYKRVDVLVNNAGITRDGLLIRMKDEDWNDVLSTNLTGVFLLTREVVAAMLPQRSGRIVNLTSVVGLTGNAGQTNYVASKAGIIGFTKALAQEIASRKITVNAVAPGFIDTEMTASLSPRVAEGLKSRIPLRRIGDVSEVSYAVRFLASKEAGYITGHVLNMNGGLYM